jgi:secreted trypsin-like serine protease
MKSFVVLLLISLSESSWSFQNVAFNLDVSLSERSVSPRIVNGQAAATNQFPHQALLYINTIQGVFQCGGSLINPTWVLSAAHCVMGFEQSFNQTCLIFTLAFDTF